MSVLWASLWDALLVLAIIGAGQALMGHHRADERQD